tara:strand:+ start:152 stop:322 length:171 start_codon:yes stop_codon:yes gene_type:complete
MAKKLEEQQSTPDAQKVSDDMMWSRIHRNTIKSQDRLKKIDRIKKSKDFQLPIDNQ